LSANIFKRARVNGHGRGDDVPTQLPRFVRVGTKILNLTYVRSIDFVDDNRVALEWSNGALIHIEGATARDGLLELFASADDVFIIIPKARRAARAAEPSFAQRVEAARREILGLPSKSQRRRRADSPASRPSNSPPRRAQQPSKDRPKKSRST
jgi:hypothetical protein